MMVAAPGRDSTTTLWPQCSIIFWPITRAMMSVEPPAANGTMILIGLSGYLSAAFCAAAFAASPAALSASQSNAPSLCLTCSSRTVLSSCYCFLDRSLVRDFEPANPRSGKLTVSIPETGAKKVDRLRCIEVFVEVARDGSFTGAARRLGMSKAATTKHVAWLEQSLGAKLLNRTTKHVGLTEAGAHALAQAQLLLDGYEAIGAGARELTETPRGVVRVGTPPSFGTHHLLPLVTRFAERYPDIRVTLMLDDGSANLITQGL